MHGMMPYDYDWYNQMSNPTDEELAKAIGGTSVEFWSPTDEDEEKRLALSNDPELFGEWWEYYNKILLNWVDPNVPASQSYWNIRIASVISWMNTGYGPFANAASQQEMKTVLDFYADAPAAVQEVIEPLIEHWKLWLYHPELPNIRISRIKTIQEQLARAHEEENNVQVLGDEDIVAIG